MRTDPRVGQSEWAGLMTVVTLEANGDGRASSGKVMRTDRGYGVVVDGYKLDEMRRFEAAVSAMAGEIQTRLPRAAADWGVRISCTTPGFGVSYGNLSGGGGGGGGGGSPGPCVEQALREFRNRSLEAAIRHGASVLIRCCGCRG